MPTPSRNLRVPDDEWADWKRRAAAEKLTVTAWVRRTLARVQVKPAATVEPRFKSR